jgi:HD-like signal output (HDOD) protein
MNQNLPQQSEASMIQQSIKQKHDIPPIPSYNVNVQNV